MKKFKHAYMYFLLAGIFLLIGIIGVIAVKMKGLPDSAMYIILLGSVGSAGKYVYWYFVDKDK